MHSKLLTLALTFLISSALSARAQVMIDFSKITCEQYVFSKVASPTTVALWLSGYYSGKRGSTVFDLQGMQANAEKIERYCRQDKNFKLPVMQAVENVFGTVR